MIRFFLPMIPPSVTAQEHKVNVRGTTPRFYDPPELCAAREKRSRCGATYAKLGLIAGCAIALVLW